MLEQIVLGIIQGVAEWLPISSEGMIILAQTNLFYSPQGLEANIEYALFLHLGTFLAALIYFRKEVLTILQTLVRYKSQPREMQNLTLFLVISTLISGCLGLVLIKLLSAWTDQVTSSGRVITFLVGIALLITAYLQLKAKEGGYKTLSDLTVRDAVLLGIVQGCAALPGLSRSGTTVAALLLCRFDKAYALKISFLMSLPIVLAGNILLNIHGFVWSTEAMTGLFFSFIFGLATIHILLKFAEKINFGYFVAVFGLLTLVAVFV